MCAPMTAVSVPAGVSYVGRLDTVFPEKKVLAPGSTAMNPRLEFRE